MAGRRPSHQGQREPGTRRHSHNARRSRPSNSKKHRSVSISEERESGRNSHLLSADALARLNKTSTRNNQGKDRSAALARPKRGEAGARRAEYREVDRLDNRKVRRSNKQKKRRVVSGAVLEEGRSRDLRGGGTSNYDSLEKDDIYYHPPRRRKSRRRLWIIIACAAVVIIVIVAVAVVVSKKSQSNSSDASSLSSIDPSSIPAGAPSWLDPFQWVDIMDFNLTYTNATVGGLPIMGLNSSWDDSAAPNPNVPALDQPWGNYATTPARGVNLGGWLSLEPFITPSLFNYDASLGIIDEYTLCTYLASSCASTLESHYSTFVTESTFQEIAAAGLDHIRIPFSYWAVQTYPGDPYVFRTSWRYLLRGIEWARKYGLRVNLDLHGLPGSQNGWNHSGRQGPIGWLNGTDGALNAQRSLDVHNSLSQFFAQSRYANIITHYGLANEPRMTFLSVGSVMNWTAAAYDMVRANGIKDSVVVFGDGFMGLAKWQGELVGYSNMALDVHQYVIFNTNQIVFNHTAKVAYACQGWTQQTEQSMDTATGFGPTLVAEWSQADTDCAPSLTDVGIGNRWTGTYNTGNASTSILTPRCPTEDSRCECADANADASQYTASYKQFLLMFAEAQMYSFEKGWGWWYWTWDTEAAAQWSYKKGLAAGILPPLAYNRSFNCDLASIPSFSDLPEYY